MTDLVKRGDDLVGPAGDLDDLDRRLVDLVRGALSDTTRRAYMATWRVWSSWCAQDDAEALPATPRTVGRYLSAMSQERETPAYRYSRNGETVVDDMEPRKIATLRRHVAALARFHRAAGHPDPTKHPAIGDAIRRIAADQRRDGTKRRKVAALLPNHVREIARGLGDSLGDRRDLALIMLAFGGALRRSELAGLHVGDLVEEPQGWRVEIRWSKTAKAGDEMEVVRIARGTTAAACPVEAVKAWRQAAGIEAGRLLRCVTRHGKVGGAMSPRAVGERVKVLAVLAGLDPDKVGGHSARRGFATASARAGANSRQIRKITRHASADQLEEYVDEAEGWDEHPGIGLL